MSDSPFTRIGLLGGTFNPVHNCHLSIAGQAQETLSLDRVLFIPSGVPPHKSRDSLAPAHHRLRMVQHAVAGLPGFTVSDVEANAPDTSYTIDTVRTLQETVKGEFWFIIGLDAFLEIGGWKSAETLLTLTNFLVLSRPPRPPFRSVPGCGRAGALASPAGHATATFGRRSSTPPGSSRRPAGHDHVPANRPV